MLQRKQLRGPWLPALFGVLSLVSDARAQRSLASALALQHSPMAETNDLAVSPPVSTEAALKAMFAGADVVFAGDVTAVHYNDGFVDVFFRVEDAVRGISLGDTYTLREWSGLWVDGARYVVGERKLMLLHAASALGFASPVGGSDGAIPLVGRDTAGTVDLRWIAARAARMPGVTGARAAAVQSTGKAAPDVTASTEAIPQAAGRMDGTVVMGLLHAWQKSAVVAP